VPLTTLIRSAVQLIFIYRGIFLGNCIGNISSRKQSAVAGIYVELKYNFLAP